MNVEPVSAGMITPASRMNTATSAPIPNRITKKSVEASWKASRRRLRSSRSVKTGTNAAETAWSATSVRSRLGSWKAIVKAENAPLVAK